MPARNARQNEIVGLASQSDAGGLNFSEYDFPFLFHALIFYSLA